MINKKARLVVWPLLLMVLLSGCEEPPQRATIMPMLNQADYSHGEGPWQVVTDRSTPVTYYEKRVYLSLKSMFILSDGTPIKSINGNILYWASDGSVVDRYGNRYQYQDVFELDKEVPLANSTAITLKGY